MSAQSLDFPAVAVLGFGTMGAGIAQVFAASGRTVTVLDTDSQRLEDGLSALTRFLSQGVSLGKVTDEQTAVLRRITTTTNVADLAGVDLVVESVTENAEVKKAVLADVAAVVRAHIPLCTNTSALSLTDLAAGVPNPARLAGLHFFNPAPLMRTVEVVRALQTEDDLIDRLVALVDTFGGDKVAVVAKDRPGFLINALLMPYLNDVIQEFDDELASAEDIDVALKLGLGYKTGPLELLDMIGLDVHLHATEAAYEATRDDRYAPPPLLRQMVAAGRLGNKSGRGFRTDQPRLEDN